jgi:predicted Zn-dependent protease
VELWQKLIHLQPQNALAYFNMGFSYLRLKRYEDTLAASKKAMELNPNLKEAVLNYANSEIVVGDILKAKTSLEDLLRRVPDYPSALGLLAATLAIMGEKESSLEMFAKLKHMGYDCNDVLFDQAEMLLSRGKNQEAIRVLEIAIASNNVHEGTRALLARCYETALQEAAVKTGTG